MTSDADTLVVEETTTSHSDSVTSPAMAVFAAKDQQLSQNQQQDHQDQQPMDTGGFGPGQQVPASAAAAALDVEYPVNFDEFLPIGDFFGNSEALDWVSLPICLYHTCLKMRATTMPSRHRIC
jgi:hypothetical protein